MQMSTLFQRSLVIKISFYILLTNARMNMHLPGVSVTIFISFQLSWLTAVIADGVPGEISKQMCTKYLDYVPDSYECPFTNDLPLGNSFATRKEFPDMVLIGYRDEDEKTRWLCSGSLITEQFVLIAAHCAVNRENGSPVVAKIGVTNVTATDNLQDIKIIEVIPHPDYKPPAVYNNIALVKLEKKIDVNSYARPACLFTGKEVEVDTAINTGWGRTSFLGDFDDRLQKVHLEIYTEKKCNDTYKRQSKARLSKGITYDTMICAGTKSIISNQPNTGGPLIIYHQEEGGNFKCISDIVGIAAFGRIGGIIKDSPDVYTRVAPYISWIEDNVWK